MIINIRPRSVWWSRIYHVMSWYPFIAFVVLGDIAWEILSALSFVYGEALGKGISQAASGCYKEYEIAWRLFQPPLGLASIGSQNGHIQRPKGFPVPHSLS